MDRQVERRLSLIQKDQLVPYRAALTNFYRILAIRKLFRSGSRTLWQVWLPRRSLPTYAVHGEHMGEKSPTRGSARSSQIPGYGEARAAFRVCPLSVRELAPKLAKMIRMHRVGCAEFPWGWLVGVVR